MLSNQKLYVLISLSLFVAHVENSFHRIDLFDDLKSQGEQARTILKIIPRTTKRICAISCSLEQRCKSFTFCKTRSCTLHSGDYSTHASKINLSGGCGNYEVRITLAENQQTTTKAGFIGIEDTATSASLMTQPPNGLCFPSSKGNGLKCIDVNDFEHWYEISSVALSWTEAKARCANSDRGILLYPATWSQNALDNLLKTLYGLRSVFQIWIGIRVGEADDLVDVYDNPIKDVPVSGDFYRGACFIASMGYADLQIYPCLVPMYFICELN